MKSLTILLLVLTSAITTFALPNFIPNSKQDGDGWIISKNDNKPSPTHNPLPIWHPQPPKPVNPWKPTPTKPAPPHYPQPPVSHQPTLSWSGSKTSTIAHLPTQSVGHNPWKRTEHFEAQKYHGGGAGKMQSVTWKPWQPPKATSSSSSSGTTSATSSLPATTSTWPAKGNGNGWNPPQAPPGYGNGWPKLNPQPEPGNGWHIAQPKDNGFGEHGRAINTWKRDDVLEA